MVFSWNIILGKSMEKLDQLYRTAKSKYDSGGTAFEEIREVLSHCTNKLNLEAKLDHFGKFSGNPSVDYSVASSSNMLSRPVRPDLFISDRKTALAAWNEMINSLHFQQDFSSEFLRHIDRTLYTCIMSFSLCYDIWKPKSRKTPGTYFEVVAGTLFRNFLPFCELSKFIRVDPDEDDLDGGIVSTDLVISSPRTGKSAVIPLKITTRERIVQPFAHQTILNSKFPDRYASFITCISEVQRDDSSKTVKQICVPGTIKLFQNHLGKIAGLYYCDVPQRYAKEDLTNIIKVSNIGQLFVDVREYLIN